MVTHICRSTYKKYLYILVHICKYQHVHICTYVYISVHINLLEVNYNFDGYESNQRESLDLLRLNITLTIPTQRLAPEWRWNSIYRHIKKPPVRQSS